MNTAARMESNSARGRIHVSEATAGLLIEARKSSWLKKREDKIVAKGKGEMQTFWVELPPRSKSILRIENDTPRSKPRESILGIMNEESIQSIPF
jgi:class 3 adenylate cyclase